MKENIIKTAVLNYFNISESDLFKKQHFLARNILAYLLKKIYKTDSYLATKYGKSTPNGARNITFALICKDPEITNHIINLEKIIEEYEMHNNSYKL